MTERLLQYIWQFRFYNTKNLQTTGGEPIRVLAPGRHNTDQGPDFSDARIRIGKATWAGTAELHIRTSDWKKHGHDDDPNYDNVILHVVWEDDSVIPGREMKGKEKGIPVLELKGRVPKHLLLRYDLLVQKGAFIPCERIIHVVKPLVWKSWKDRLLAERLVQKADLVKKFLDQNNGHWEETCWWLLARNFGIRVNADAFESMARSIPLTVLAKHKQQVQQVEALLFGQAGLLNKPVEGDYPVLLQKEYRFLSRKYGLRPISIPVYFLRMRPVNFPTIRLAQLAMLIVQSSHLFSKILETRTYKDLRQWFEVTANDYWHYHYRFDENSPYREKQLGEAMIDNLIINTVVPLLFAYGYYHGEQPYKDRALAWLERAAPENNQVTRGFAKLGVANKNAFDSQALLALKQGYCEHKNCLACHVGNAILRS